MNINDEINRIGILSFIILLVYFIGALTETPSYNCMLALTGMYIYSKKLINNPKEIFVIFALSVISIIADIIWLFLNIPKFMEQQEKITFYSYLGIITVLINIILKVILSCDEYRLFKDLGGSGRVVLHKNINSKKFQDENAHDWTDSESNEIDFTETSYNIATVRRKKNEEFDTPVHSSTSCFKKEESYEHHDNKSNTTLFENRYVSDPEVESGRIDEDGL